MMIYGESGTGKTTLAGSADAVPSMRPVLVIDIEGGTESLRHSYPEVEVVRVRTWQEMQSIYNALYEGGHGFQTVVLDSLTEIMKFSMYQIMGDLVKRGRNSGEEVDPDIPSMREWGKNIEQVRRFVRGFRDLPINTIFTALVRSEKDAKSGITTFMPSLSGKVAGEVAAFLDLVFYYYVKDLGDTEEGGQTRLLLTRRTERAIAKDRSGKLPMVIESPTMLELYKLMYAKPNPNGETKEDKK
jgi:AAA domain-containing protein